MASAMGILANSLRFNYCKLKSSVLVKESNLVLFYRIPNPVVLSNNTVLKLQCRQRSTATVYHEENVKSFSEIPTSSGLSTALSFITGKHTTSKIHLFFKELNQKHRDIVKLKSGPAWSVMIFHPDDVQKVFTVPQDNPYRPPPELLDVYYKRNNALPGFANLNGELWWTLRRSAQDHIMKPQIISNYVPLLSSVADDFITYLETKNEIDDCLQEMKKFTAESVGMLSLTTKMNNFTDKPKYDLVSHLTEAFDLFHKALYAQLKLFKYFRTPLYNKFEKEYSIINRIVDKMVEDRLKAIHESNQIEANEQNDFLLALLSDSRITPQQAHTIIRELFAGGIESTSNAMTFLLFELAKNMDKQEKLREEVMTTCKDGVTREALSNMHYLKSCVKETFRMFPPSLVTGVRKFDKDIVVGGYLIPKETLIMAVPHSMLENEEFFPKHDQFIPERWLRSVDEKGLGARNIYPFSHTPFGHGVRSCIGQRFGETQMYVAIAKIIQNFRVHLPEGIGDIEYTYKTFATPSKIVPLSMEAKQDALEE